MAEYFLLGPQRPTVNLDAPFESLDHDRPVAVVSAGWQEAEGDIDDVHEIVRRPLMDLELYRRADEVLASEARLQAIHRERQDLLQELQRLYRIRLSPSMQAARRLLRDDGDPALLKEEQRHAMRELRTLDRYHLRRINEIHKEADARIAGERLPKLAEHRAGIDAILSRCRTVIIPGGNVAVLLNRLRLFGLGPLLASKNIVAWSAGAMVLSDRVVLFHYNTPQGDRDPELFDAGLGIVSGFVFLPDAQHRLKLNDKIRVALFCRRFSPAACIPLDSGSMLRYRDGGIRGAERIRRLSRGGTLRKMRVR